MLHDQQSINALGHFFQWAIANHWMASHGFISFTLFPVIESFRHKRLQELFEKCTRAKLQKPLADRALRRLDAIEMPKTQEASNVPGFDFHGLQGNPKRYSVLVNGPWCITFEWLGENAVNLDFENYL